MIDQNGAAYDAKRIAGRYQLVYFGYTNCPDICPTSLFEMGAALDLLAAPQRARIVPVFVTVDPTRDTQAVMKAYVGPLGRDFIAVTGPLDVIDRFAWEHQVVAVRPVGATGGYAVDHTAAVLLLDPAGAVVERFPYEMDYREVARRLAGHLAPR